MSSSGTLRHRHRATRFGPIDHIDGGVLDVLGHINRDRPGAARFRQLEGERHDVQQFGGMPHEEIVFG